MLSLAVRAVLAVLAGWLTGWMAGVVHDSPLARRNATLKIGDFGHLDDSPFGLDECLHHPVSASVPSASLGERIVRP